MDSVLLALAVKIYKKLLNFITDLQSDFYGTGEMGNCIVTSDSNNVELGWTQLTPQTTINDKNIYQLPISLSTQFNNLIIDTNTIFTTTMGVPYLFLYVRDTLEIRAGSELTMSNRGANISNFAPFLPRPGIGQSTPTYTTACLRMFVSGRDIRNTYDLSCYGSNPNSTSGISGGGTMGAGGGLLALYYKGSLKDQNGNIYETATNIHCNGGGENSQSTTLNIGGGMLFIFAKNIILNTGAHISCDGGDGQGLTSYWKGTPQISSNTVNGGGGVVVDVPMRVQ